MLFVVFQVKIGWRGKKLIPEFKSFNESSALKQMQALQDAEPENRFAMDVVYDPSSHDLEGVCKV